MTIARPYAVAAFEYAAEKKDFDSWENLLNAASQIASDKAVTTMMKNPETSAAVLAEFFCGVLKPMLDKHKSNFIHLLAENHRLTALPEIASLFSATRAEAEKTLTVEVTSAEPLAKPYQEKLIKALTKRLARKVKLACEVNQDLLGGIIIRAGDLVIDGSIRGKLDRLNNFI